MHSILSEKQIFQHSVIVTFRELNPFQYFVNIWFFLPEMPSQLLRAQIHIINKNWLTTSKEVNRILFYFFYEIIFIYSHSTTDTIKTSNDNSTKLHSKPQLGLLFTNPPSNVRQPTRIRATETQYIPKHNNQNSNDLIHHTCFHDMSSACISNYLNIFTSLKESN